MEQNIEVEIQVKVDNSEDLLAFLQKEGRYDGEKRQIDKYYSPEGRDFFRERPLREMLRLRDSSGKFSINYKKINYGSSGTRESSDEYESGVGDIANLEKILTSLGMKMAVVVDKVRRIWNYQNYEICFDRVKGLGDFVEVEYKGQVAGRPTSEIIGEMINFLKRFDCGRIRRSNTVYPFQLMFPKEAAFVEE